MVLIGIGVVLILMTKVVPEILGVIQKSGKSTALPLPTEILLVVSGFIGAYWWAILGAVAGAWIAYVRAWHTPPGRLWIDTQKLGLPLVGPLLRKACVSRFAITLATLLESGLPVLDALNVVK